MRCGRCNSDNRVGRRFCAECGDALALLCSGCGASNLATEKFCGDCGAPLTPAPRPSTHVISGAGLAQPGDRPEAISSDRLPDGERKTITALFADIKGSMELMEDLDPEDARAIIDPALQIMMEAVRHYGGHVAQSTGDGIFALFGAPIAHEDHPQRAFYAAIRMQQEMARYDETLRLQKGINLKIRVGINTGEVVVRSVRKDDSHADYLPVGHSTGLAARMQSLAAPGAIVVSEHAQKLCDGYFQFKDLGPTKVKGLSDPINVYEVTGLGPLRTRLQVAARRGFSKFVGRQLEIEQLNRALELAKSGHGQVVGVVGEPGVGKSRLLHEFKSASASGCLVLEAFSVSHGKASAYLPVIELLEGYFEIAPGDDVRRRREKVGGKVLMLDRTLEDALPHLLGLLGVAEAGIAPGQVDVQVRKRRTLDALKRLFLRESMARPVVLVFEDLHWIDNETQSFVNLMVESIASSRILIFVNFRPEYHHSWGNKSMFTQLRLDPLGTDNTEEMLRELLGGSDDLRGAREFIAIKAEGNPFFIEELVQALFEEGALIRDGTIKQVKPLATLKLPPSAQGVLAARVDRLGSAEKELLQILSVIGTEFALRLIERVTRRGEDDLRPLLERLQAAEFVYEQPAIAGTEYIFKHALTHDVAYNSVLTDRRKELHEQVAEGIEALQECDLDEHFGELAHHYGRSNNTAKAARYARMAGQRAYFRWELEEALRYLANAVALLAQLPESAERDRQEVPVQLLIGICRANNFARPIAEAAYARALELAERLGHSSSIFRALMGMQVVSSLRPEKAAEYSKRMVQLAERARDPVMLTEAYSWHGMSLLWSGDLAGARVLLERSAASREKLPANARFYYQDPLARIEGDLSSVLLEQGFPDKALRFAERSQASAERVFGQNYGELLNLTVLNATLHRRVRNAKRVAELTEKAIALAKQHGLGDYGAIPLHGWAVAFQGQAEEGISELSLSLAQPQRATGYVTEYSQFDLAEVFLEVGRLDEALGIVDRLLSEERRELTRAELYRLRANILIARDPSSTTEAEALLREAVAKARQCGAKMLELRATTSLARLLAKQGKRDEARAMLAEIYNWFTEGFDTADLIEAKALLDGL